MSLHPAVRLMALVEARRGHPGYAGDDPRYGQPPRFYPKADYRAGDYDRLVEERYAGYLGSSDADVRAGRLDTRALIPGTATRVQLPYRLSDGCLGLRVWDRPVYAEIDDVLIAADGLRISGRMVGAEPADPVLELRSIVTRELAVSVTDSGFAVRIGALPAGTWRLSLRCAPGRPAVRLGRLLDDVVRKDIAYVLPSIITGGVTMLPHYDANNEFSIRVTR
jgi:hypothetical protein